MFFSKHFIGILCLTLTLSSGFSEDFSILKSPRVLYATSASSTESLSSSGFILCDSLWVSCPQSTSVSATWDEANLTFHFTMSESPDNMKYLHGREKFEITSWSNNMIEVLIQPPEGRKNNYWFHLAVDCANHIFWARENEISEMPGTVNSKEISSAALIHEVTLRADGWDVTVTIPFAELGTDPRAGDWRINMGRTRNIEGNVTYYAWNRTKGYQEYKNFGYLRFQIAMEAAQDESRYIAALKDYQQARQNIVSRLKSTIYPWKYAFGKSKAYRSLNATYSASAGYGWLEAGVKEAAFDQKKARSWNYPINSLCDNFVYNDQPDQNGKITNHFQIDLPNGHYKVHLLSGLIIEEKIPHRRRFTLFAQGKKINRYEVGTITYIRDFFHVDISNGKLVLTFDGDTSFPDRPETVDWAGKGGVAKYYIPGWIVNAICVYPVSERTVAEKQIAIDQLELLKTSLIELAKYEEVTINEPELPASKEDSERGFVLFQRPIGESLYPGSRPKLSETVTNFTLRAVAGEPVNIPFGLLPLQNIDQVSISTDAPWLTVYGAEPIAWKLDGGKYSMVPWHLENFTYCDRDMTQGETRFLWLAGLLPENSKPGTYRSVCRITIDNRTTEIPIIIDVLPFQLEKRRFHFGGDFCSGYNKPIRFYDDVILEECQRWSVNTATLTLIRPENKDAYADAEANLRFLKKIGYPRDYVIVYPAPYLAEEDIPLREKKIDKLSDHTMELYNDVGAWVMKKMAEDPSLRLIYYFMDEAHCKGEPYWSEQIRVLKMLRKNYPTLHLMASESYDSFWRSKDLVDYPRIHEMEDFNLPEFNGKFLSVYPNQLMLAPADCNGARFITGWLTTVTQIRAVYVWQLFEQLQVHSGLQRSPYTMFVQSGVGGYRVLPRIATVMGQVGLYDQYYYFTLQSKVEAAKGSGNLKRIAAAKAIEHNLAMLRNDIHPSYVWYSRNDGVWPAKTFAALREMVTDSILELDVLQNGADIQQGQPPGKAATRTQAWWNDQWHGRLPVTVSTGLAPTENAIVSVKLDCREADRSSIRVVNERNEAVPFAIRNDAAGQLYVGWRIPSPGMLEEHRYMVYFDTAGKTPLQEPAGFPKNFPGMNLLSNSDWAARDAHGDIVDWMPSSKGYGQPDAWTAENRKFVAIEKLDGRCALSTTRAIMAPISGLEPGRTYRFSFEGKNAEPQLTTVTLWFRGETFRHYLPEYENYKMQFAVSSPGTWVSGSASTFGYIDAETKKVCNAENKLLPGTASAFLDIEPRGNKKFWIANPVLEDVTEQPLNGKIHPIEWQK